MLLFYVLQKGYFHKSCTFSRTNYHTSLQGPILCRCHVTGSCSTMLLLLILGSYKLRCRGDLRWNNVNTEFREHMSTGSKLKAGYTKTQTHTHTHSMMIL